MAPLLQLAGIAIAVGLALLASKDASAKPGALPPATKGYAAVGAEAFRVAKLAGFTDASARWFERMAQVQAYSESKGNSNAANRTDSERDASRALFEARRQPGGPTNQEKLRASLGPLPSLAGDGRAWWYPGSGGWYGLMPATLTNLVYPRDASQLGLDHDFIFDPARSTVAYLFYLHRLTARGEWERSSKDARALKAGGAAGSLMDNPTAPRYIKAQENLDAALAQLGIPRSWANEPAPVELEAGRDWLALMGKV